MAIVHFGTDAAAFGDDLLQDILDERVGDRRAPDRMMRDETALNFPIKPGVGYALFWGDYTGGRLTAENQNCSSPFTSRVNSSAFDGFVRKAFAPVS